MTSITNLSDSPFLLNKGILLIVTQLGYIVLLLPIVDSLGCISQQSPEHSSSNGKIENALQMTKNNAFSLHNNHSAVPHVEHAHLSMSGALVAAADDRPCIP